MKTFLLALTLFATCQIAARAATPEQEKDFVDRYKKALESNDTAALSAFLHTTGATPDTIEFFTMMASIAAGQKISSIELVTPSPEEIEKFNKPVEMPDGRKYKMPFPPSKQLVVVVETNEGGGTNKSVSKSPVAEKDGKLVIPVPVPAD